MVFIFFWKKKPFHKMSEKKSLKKNRVTAKFYFVWLKKTEFSFRILIPDTHPHTSTKCCLFNSVINFDTLLLKNNFYLQTSLSWTKAIGTPDTERLYRMLNKWQNSRKTPYNPIPINYSQ